MTVFKGLMKLKNGAGGFDIIMPKTEAALVTMQNGETVEVQVMANKNALDAIEAGKNKANGFMQLDGNGLVPAAFIPNEFKEIKIVENIAGRDVLENKFAGLSVYVKDASADNTVNTGGAYYLFDGADWIKTAESESLDVVLNWSAIEGKPDTLAGYGITDAVNIDLVSDVAAANKLLKLNADGKLQADVVGNADTASKLAVDRKISLSGDASGSVNFNGSADADIKVVLANSGVVAGQYTKVTVDAKGRVTAGANLVAADIPGLDWAKIVSGKPTTLEGYGIVDAVNKNGDTMAGFLTLHANPTEDMHAATKAYVDSVIQGLDVKESVRVATVANIALSGAQVIDGVQVNAGDRVLVKNQTNAAENGIYVAAKGDWVKADDAQALNPGVFTFVEEGSVNANNGFVLGADAQNFSQFSGMGHVIVGTGLGKNGNEIYLKDTGVVAGQYTKVTVDAQGRVTAATNLESTDLPEIAWNVIVGKPDVAVNDIEDAVAKRHEHANKAQLDKIGEVDGVLAYDNVKMATQAFAQSMIQASAVEPVDMPVNGLWIEIVE